MLGTLLFLGLSSVAVSGPTDAQSVQQGMNDFTFRLTRQILKDSPANACVSPLSVSLCLSTLLDGAKGQSFGLLRDSLGYAGLDLRQIDAGSKAVVQGLVDSPNHPFTVANSVWLRSDFKPNAAYLSSVKKYYDADFMGVPNFGPATEGRINAWTKEKTKDRIPKIVSSLEPSTVLILVNALTFDADWEKQFDPKLTKSEAFHLSKTSSVETPTMHDGRNVPYAETPTSTAIRLPYKGGQYSMILMLPKDDTSASDVLSNLDAASFGQLTASLQKPTRVNISLPKFDVEGSYELKEPLSALGLGPLFQNVNLGGISEQISPTKVSKVVHKTYLKLNEKGTEAAAATAVIVTRSAILHPQIFKADRPFAYLLVNDKTNVVLFAGVCGRPTAG